MGGTVTIAGSNPSDGMPPTSPTRWGPIFRQRVSRHFVIRAITDISPPRYVVTMGDGVQRPEALA